MLEALEMCAKVTPGIMTWEHLERDMNWDLKPGTKFERKPLGRIKGISGRGRITKARKTEARSRANTSWLGLEVKGEEEGSSRKGWGPEHRSGNEIP